MARLLSFFTSLFSRGTVAAEDHLMGAVDLSDAAYCLSLLSDLADL